VKRDSVLIIGAGPAGAVASVLLARSEWDVTLVEQSRFPRDKVCGECLSAVGLDVLRRHELARLLEPFNPVTLTRAALHAPDGSSVTLDLPGPMWGISRLVMDEVLLEAARDAGARVLQPARCETLESTTDHVSVTLRDLTTNTTQSIETSHAILADGRGALLPARPMPTDDFGIKTHFVNVDAPTDTIALFGVNGHYGGLAPIENDRWNVAFSVPKSRLKSGAKNLDALFTSIVSENDALRRQFRRATRVSDWLTSPLPRFAVADEWPARVIPIGNAAAALEPVGGEGMGLAMKSAELAADALLSGSSMDQLKQSFDALWTTRRAACRATAMLMSRPTLAQFAVPLVDAMPGLHRAAMSLIGK